jgi:flagellar assembly protein FliH
MKKQPNYTFNIDPGLDIRNARITTDEISIEESVFSEKQLLVFEKILNAQIQALTEDFNDTLENEKKTAWTEGNQAGIDQTTNELLASVTQVIDSLKEMTQSLSFQTETFMQYHEQELLSLVISIARKVIDVEIMLNPEIIINTLRRSLEYLNEKEEIKILVNPSDWDLVKENLHKLSMHIDLPKNTEVIPSDMIAPGGAKIDFKAGSIDADIETQFAEIKRNLHKADVHH